MKHERKSSHYKQSKNRRIIRIIEASSFIKELSCHFILSSVWCIESIIFREKVRAFLYARSWWLGFEHHTRWYCEANIRQVFIYETKLWEIVSLQFYYWNQSTSYYLLSKHCFKKSFETHWEFLSDLLTLTEHAVFISHFWELNQNHFQRLQKKNNDNVNDFIKEIISWKRSIKWILSF